MNRKLKERLNKLKNLAERGVGGEKETAEKKLSQLLKANGLTEKDLSEDRVDFYLFGYVYPYRQKLLSQVIYKVLGPNNFSLYRSSGTRNKIGAYCTAAQKVEIELEFEFYSNLFDEELDTFVSAFIYKQDIYPKDAPTTNIDIKDMTPEEIAKFRKKQSYASAINKRTRSLMIEGKDE